METVHRSMRREQSRGRDAMIALCTLDAPARVAGFLVNWAKSLAGHGLRNDQITLRLTRAEIGSYSV